MNRTNRIVLLSLLASLALPSAAAAQAGAARPQLGVGVAVVPLDAAGVLNPIEIYVPLQVSPMLRVEPSLGIYSRNAGGDGTDTRDITLGVGVLALKRLGPATDLQFGGRLKLNFASYDAGVVDDSGVDIVLAGAFGGEQWLSDHFSLGLEGQLGFYSLSDASGDASGLYTAGLFFARVYF